MNAGWRNLMVLFLAAGGLWAGAMMTTNPALEDRFRSGSDSDEIAELSSIPAVESPSQAPHAVVLFVGEDRIAFSDDVICMLDTDSLGTIEANTADGTALSVLLADPVSALRVDGPPGSFTALITSVDRFEQALSLSADPPGVEVVVELGVCANAA
ncbi:MAG: hypothetical protein ACR2QK_00830 [Acidimicrobiales bacterium]